MTAAIAGLVTCAVSCAKKNNDTSAPPTSEPPATNAPSAATNAPAPATNSVVVTNVPAVTNTPTEVTNTPTAEITNKAPEVITATDTNLPGHTVVVEMPATIPAAPTNFYPTEVTSNASLTPIGGQVNTNFFLRFRVGYEHIYHGDNANTYTLGAKLYAYGDGLRQSAGKNAWLIPDADLDLSSQYLPKPDNSPNSGSGNGLRLRADFMWPWLRWSTKSGREDSLCPFAKPLAFSVGPTVNLGFDHLYDEDQFRFANYAGVRFTFNRSGFIEYTVGRTEGLDSTRQQIVAEIPFYESRDGEVHYTLRGLWNHGSNSKPDDFEVGFFLEMPFATIVTPSKWNDLVPFAK